MNKLMEVLQWILGIVAALSLILGVIFKIAGVVVLTAHPSSFLWFTVTCCLASIALSMLKISCKHKGAPEAPAAKPEGKSTEK